jgi:2-dehydro-3-deoxygluconokinase
VSAPPPQVVTLGETMVLLVAEQPGALREATTFRRSIGGAESNVAIGLCRLGHSAGWISRLGDDELGQHVLFRLRGEGVDLTHVTLDPARPTGVLIRERREVGPLEVLYYRAGSAASAMSAEDVDESYVASARYLLVSGITAALSASCREAVFAAAEIARAAGVTVVLDPNLRLKLWTRDLARATLRDLAARSDVVLPGADEAELLTGESDPQRAARALLALGPRTVVVKLGAEGALALTSDTLERVPAQPLARVVDPIGAGDAFAAGFLAGQLRSMDLRESVALAARCGALATTVAGDVEGLPTWRDVGEAALGDVRR